MSHRVKTETTLTVAGMERDVFVRGRIEVERACGEYFYEFDGDVEIQIDGRWVDIESDELGVSASDLENARDVLIETIKDDDTCEPHEDRYDFEDDRRLVW